MIDFNSIGKLDSTRVNFNVEKQTYDSVVAIAKKYNTNLTSYIKFFFTFEMRYESIRELWEKFFASGVYSAEEFPTHQFDESLKFTTFTLEFLKPIIDDIANIHNDLSELQIHFNKSMSTAKIEDDIDSYFEQEKMKENDFKKWKKTKEFTDDV